MNIQHNPGDQPHSSGDDKLKARRRSGVASLGFAATLLLSACTASSAQNPESSSQEAWRGNHDTELLHELKNAFEGPVQVVSAVNTGEVVYIEDVETPRGNIELLLEGYEHNLEVAQDDSLPTYFYNEQLTATLRLEEGEEIPAVVRWDTERPGMARLQPNLTPFMGGESVTLPYDIYLVAWGLDASGDTRIASHSAGTVLVTGQNGEISDVVLAPVSHEPSKRVRVETLPLDSQFSLTN